MDSEDIFYVKVVKNFMSENNLNQKELAARLELDPATISNWFNGSKHGITQKNKNRIELVCSSSYKKLKNNITGNNNVTVNGGNNNFLSNETELMDKFRSQLIDAIMSSDKIDPASKIEVYNIIKQTR